MTISPETTVGDLAARYPSVIRVFRHLGIEFCCGGRQTLVQACQDRHISWSDARQLLTEAARTARPDEWSQRDLTDLTTHVVDAFHDPLKQELPRLHELAKRVQGHGDSHRRALAVVLHELARFRAELEVHMGVEERELFPLIARLAAGDITAASIARFSRLRATLEADHDDAGQTLRLLSQVTDHYRPPADACASVRALYRGLDELERLTHLHVHMENNMLFPRAAALLAGAGSTRIS